MHRIIPRFHYLTTCLFLLFINAFNLSYAQMRDLDFYLEQAKVNSPELRNFQNQVRSLQIDSMLLKATLGPQLNFISNNSYAPIVRGYGYDEAVTNIANVSGLIQASRNFLAKGNATAQYRTLALQRRALFDTIMLSQQELIRTITEQYISVYASQLASEYNREVYQVMKNEEEILKKLTRASVYKQTDYLTFYVTMQQQELTYLEAEIQFNADYFLLNYLSGIQDTTIQKLSKPELPDIISTDFYNSVFFQRFTTDSMRIANQNELIKYEYKPRVGVYTDAGFNSSMQLTPYKNFGVSAGVSVVIPLYDGHQRQMKESKLNIEERTRQSNRQYYESQYRIQVQLLKQQISSIDGIVDKINKQIEFSQTLITANGKLLQTGDITMKDYVIAINNYLSARNLLTQNNINRLKILNQLNYWNIKP